MNAEVMPTGLLPCALQPLSAEPMLQFTALEFKSLTNHSPIRAMPQDLPPQPLIDCLQVIVEQASGAVDLEFLHSDFTNAYINITNVLLILTPTAAMKDTPAVLVNTHYDSTLGSPGLASLHHS